METVLISVLTSVLGSLFVGFLLAKYKVSLDQQVKAAAETAASKDKMILDKIELVNKKTLGLEGKMEVLTKDVHRMDMRVEVVVVQQAHIAESVARIEKEVEKTVRYTEGFGKVVRK